MGALVRLARAGVSPATSHEWRARIRITSDYILRAFYRRRAVVARRVHNSEVVGANPAGGIYVRET